MQYFGLLDVVPNKNYCFINVKCEEGTRRFFLHHTDIHRGVPKQGAAVQFNVSAVPVTVGQLPKAITAIIGSVPTAKFDGFKVATRAGTIALTKPAPEAQAQAAVSEVQS
jgi:sorbitol-specific phosphotransferase system component IIA